MKIREYKKDNIKDIGNSILAVKALDTLYPPASEDAYTFWTKHPKRPVRVSLEIFKEGEKSSPCPGGTWSGPLMGRPALIEQLAPVIKEVLEFAAPDTVEKYMHSLRTWWRIFDALDENFEPVKTVEDISEIHRQYAMGLNLNRLAFSNFIRIINLYLLANGMSQLRWYAPRSKSRKRYLPPDWQTKLIRLKIKHEWFNTISRWDRAVEMQSGSLPYTEEERLLLKNYKHFNSIQSQQPDKLPRSAELMGDLTTSQFNDAGYNIGDMMRGKYPDAYDIRIAFHSCLATTGWNPSVLLDLDVREPFLETHPKDPKRYIMYGFKARGGTEQVSEGLISSKGSAGMIIKRLMLQTQPLRNEIEKQFKQACVEFSDLKKLGATHQELDNMKKKCIALEKRLRSPWLYATDKNGIQALDSSSYHRRLNRDEKGSFTHEIVEAINLTRPTTSQITAITASDFRDAFAAYAYQVSGGMVLFVKNALGHRRVSTTQTYLNNSLINESSQKIYRTFSSALWHEVQVHKKVDPTILARWMHDGEPTNIDRKRLEDYRKLRLSRLGIGCKDSKNPPSRIAPNFHRLSSTVCNVQRCTLCYENAVILPSSLSGLCMRQAELEHIRKTISVAAFMESSFLEELENTQAALNVFNEHIVEKQVKFWRDAISTNKHRVPTLEGI